MTTTPKCLANTLNYFNRKDVMNHTRGTPSKYITLNVKNAGKTEIYTEENQNAANYTHNI